MTTNPPETTENYLELNGNLEKLEHLTKRFVSVFNKKDEFNPAINAPGGDLWLKATQTFWQNYSVDPSKMITQQIKYWGEAVTNFVAMQQEFVKTQPENETQETCEDKRFAHPFWSSNPYFSFIKQQYLKNAEVMRASVAHFEGLSDVDAKRLRYFTDQVIDMMAPTNFLNTNPEALEMAVQTQGQSLLDGLENLIADLEANEGELVVRLADENAFVLGENIATTKGDVVSRNRMHELIQFSPTTETVHEIPLIIFPPWINKYYVLDLKEQNSFVKWAVDQGFTVFVVSWVNPDFTYDDVSLEDYITDGYLAAIDAAKSICKSDHVNAIGYCIGGTTLALTLAYLKQRNDNSIKSATFFTTLTDFAQQGDFLPFLQDDFVDGIAAEVEKYGILKSYVMARTFSFLRSNDLIYGPAIRSYMLGKAPPAFDLLYWNGDGTNLPGVMAMQYLRGLCQKNEFAQEGFSLFGTVLKLQDVDVPLFGIGCETDHIAPWKDSYRGIQQMSSESKTFVMAQSGHIAGIVNPPSKKKYGYFKNANLQLNADDWLKGSEFIKSSWWPFWASWLAEHSGPQVAARVPGTKEFPALVAAPGEYVKRRLNQP